MGQVRQHVLKWPMTELGVVTKIHLMGYFVNTNMHYAMLTRKQEHSNLEVMRYSKGL